MKNRIFSMLTALSLTLALLCPAAWAAASPTLLMEQGGGGAQLTLRGLEDRQVSSIQLELTLSGSYPKADFQLSQSIAGQYSYVRSQQSGGQTTVTIYIDGPQSMNQTGTISLGSLSLGGTCTTPGTAQLTLLDRSLVPTVSTIAVQSGSGSSSGSSSSGGGSSSDSGGSYTVRASGGEGGKVTVSSSRAKPGTAVTVTVQPDDGFQLSELTAQAAGRQLRLTGQGSGKYTFTMPAANVTVTGSFAPQPTRQPLHFRDVPEGIWFYDAVAYAYENGLMSGTGADTFSPDLSTSRGMIVAILYRLAGSPQVGSASFTDVADSQYYAKAVAWASANGVVSGYGNGRFGPDDSVTREQLALIFRSFARLNGIDVSAQADLSGFADVGKVSSYALEAVSWAHAQGLINGISASELGPGGTATRSQAAVILKSFCQNILHSD